MQIQFEIILHEEYQCKDEKEIIYVCFRVGLEADGTVHHPLHAHNVHTIHLCVLQTNTMQGAEFLRHMREHAVHVF